MQQKLKLPKEEIHGLNYFSWDVIEEVERKKSRIAKLEKALSLGNIYKNHVKLIFMDARSRVIETEATIWAVTEKYVVLKSRVMIPIKSIMDVNYT